MCGTILWEKTNNRTLVLLNTPGAFLWEKFFLLNLKMPGTFLREKKNSVLLNMEIVYIITYILSTQIMQAHTRTKYTISITKKADQVHILNNNNLSCMTLTLPMLRLYSSKAQGCKDF